jgi:(p)ppGpp synthase/HD superfamily hydrolase
MVKLKEIILKNNFKIDWIFNKHVYNGNLYDGKPYSFHLKMCTDIMEIYIHNLNDEDIEDVYLAVNGHDLLENTNTNYENVFEYLGENVSNIIFAVTHPIGRNRKEKNSIEYFEKIRNTKNAVFVKLCDRIANVTYSKSNGNAQKLQMYKDEHKDFERMIGRYTNNKKYEDMFVELDKLFN